MTLQMYRRPASVLGLATFLVACHPPPEQAPDVERRAAGDTATGLPMPRAAAASDSVRQILTRIERAVAPLREWRDSAVAILRPDSATLRADSTLLRLRTALQLKVREATETFYDPGFQLLVWPDGPMADYRRRMQLLPDRPTAPEEIALADSVVAYLGGGGIWSSRGEGQTHFSASDARLLMWLGRFVTPQIQAFLRFAAHQQAAPIADDAALMVPPDELARRIVTAEQLLYEFPDSPARPFISFRYHQYLAVFLGGLPNTPAFDRQTRALRSDFRQSHEQFLRLHGSTAAGRVIAQYVRLLERGGYTRSPEVDAFLQTRWSEAHAQLPRS